MAARVITKNPHLAAHQHFSAALAFYAAHNQEDSAIAQMAAGLVALSAQVARIELAVIEAHSC